MDHRINELHHTLYSPQKKKPAMKSTVSFQSYMNEAIGKSAELKVSKHAEKRMLERKLSFNEQTWSTLNKLVHEAKQKGIKDSLVLTKEAALIVNAENHTIITAMGRNEIESQIFTNINGTIIME